MPFNVTMPDGTVVKGVPDGTSKADFDAKYQQNVGTAPKEASQQPQKDAQIPEDKGLIGNIKQDITNRFNTGVGIMQKPGQNPASVGLQMAGKVVAGTANDIIGDTAKAAYKATPDISNWKEKVEGGIQKAMSSPIGKMALQAAQKGGLEYANWARENPDVAANVESLVDIASVIPGAKAAGTVGKVASDITPVVGSVKKGIMAPNAEKMAAITDTMHKQATNTIENVKNSGVKFKPRYLDTLTKELGAHPDLKTEGERSVRPNTTSAVADITDSIKKGDTSLRNLIGFHDKLTQIIGQGGQDGNAAIKARNTLDKTLNKIPEFTKFQKQWGQYKTGEQVAAAAALSDVSASKSRAAFQKIVDSPYFKSLSPEVQKLTKVAAKGKMSGKFLDAVGSLKTLMGAKTRIIGKHLPALEMAGAVASGHPAIAAGIGGVMAASKGGKLVQKGIGADVLKALQEGK